MKTTKIIVIILFLFTISCSKKYEKIIDKYNYISINGSVEDDFLSFYFENGYFPKDNEIFYYITNKPELMNSFDLFIIDPFGKGNTTFKYIPIYNKKTKLPDSFILLSAGIDGKINNVIKDTLFENEISKLKIYNNTNYSLKNKIFGKKDLIFLHINGFEYMLMYKDKYSISSLYNYISNNYDFCFKIFRYKSPKNKIKTNKKNKFDFIIVDNSKYQISNILYYKDDLSKIMQSSLDSICFIGIFKEYNIKTKEIVFINVHVISDSVYNQ